MWALVLLDSVPGLTHSPPPTKEKKVGLKWLKMDFKGMYFIFFSRKLPPPETPTHPLIENSIKVFFNASLIDRMKFYR